LPRESDLAVVGPMARSAADLSLLLDVIAGPDRETRASPIGWSFRRRGIKSSRISRVLVLDSHPLAVTQGSVARRHRRAGQGPRRCRATVGAGRTLLPGLVDAAGSISLLRAFSALPFRQRCTSRSGSPSVAWTPAISASPPKAWGWTMSHRDWLIDDAKRTRLRAQWAALFGTFRRGDLPGHADPAFPHDRSGRPDDRRIAIDWLRLPMSTSLSGRESPGARPAGDAIPVGLSPDRVADRSADHRPLAGGPHAPCLAALIVL